MDQNFRELPIRPAAGITIARDNLLHILEAVLDPLVIVFTLWGIGIYVEGELSPPYIILSLVMFSMTFPGKSNLNLPIWRVIRSTLLSWFLLSFLLVFFGFSTHYIETFPSGAINLLLWLPPIFQVIASLLLRVAAPSLLQLQGSRRRAVIAGINDQGEALARRVTQSRYNHAELVGFFEDRHPERVNKTEGFSLLGGLADLPEYVRKNDINTIYLSLPMASQPRIMKLLDDLKDSTASIYFVPDMFMTDLIQGRMDHVDGIPVVAVCETPFTGVDGAVKRISDVLLSILILLMISPILILISLGVKYTSPGPIIFKQRRYGLDGKEIVVYKFRSMTVTEDGGQIKQAQKQDKRITPLGAFLRKSSLDELPQFINVLQGRMSIVGPRPHAVAHNEMYRKLIKGYMIRHKVKPGITGWAQVNGLRGETDTLDKMKARIDYDLDYLRNWSLRLDIHIILKTVLVVFKDKNAY